MKIAYSKKRTHNLGNYENIVIEINAEDEVNHLVETEQGCFLRLKTFVDNKLQEQLLEVTKKKTQEKITEVKTDSSKWDEVKNLIISIVKQDDSKREVIKQYMLSQYTTSKVNDLSYEQLLELDKYLRDLC